MLKELARSKTKYPCTGVRGNCNGSLLAVAHSADNAITTYNLTRGNLEVVRERVFVDNRTQWSRINFPLVDIGGYIRSSSPDVSFHLRNERYAIVSPESGCILMNQHGIETQIGMPGQYWRATMLPVDRHVLLAGHTIMSGNSLTTRNIVYDIHSGSTVCESKYFGQRHCIPFFSSEHIISVRDSQGATEICFFSAINYDLYLHQIISYTRPDGYCVSRCGRFLAIIEFDESTTIELIELVAPRQVFRVSQPGLPTRPRQFLNWDTIAFNSDSDRLFVPNSSGGVSVYSTNDGKLISTFNAHTSSIVGLAVLDGGAGLITATETELAVWGVETGRDNSAMRHRNQFTWLRSRTLPTSDDTDFQVIEFEG